jgi:hypothetical protein
MIDTLTFKGRLPGVVCEMALPPQAEDPLRLDVAAFVGFAERGPLNTPMMLEDIRQYTAIFGGDLVIARQKGNPVYAHLPRAVAAFFDNGGRRCYAVRVAGDGARPNRFRMPGLMAWGNFPRLTIAPAAWVGRWSDGMRLNAQLRSLPLKIQPGNLPFSPLLGSANGQAALAAELHLEVPTRTLVRTGDLLRLYFGAAGETQHILYFPVTTVVPGTQAALPGQPASTVRGIPIVVHTTGAFLFEVVAEPSANVPALIERLGEAGWQLIPSQEWGDIPLAKQGIQPLAEPKGDVSLALPEKSAVFAGDLLRLAYEDGGPLLLRVKGVTWTPLEPDPPAPEETVGTYPVTISQPPLRELAPADAVGALGLAQPIQADLLRFDLRISEGDQSLMAGLPFGDEIGYDEVWTELRFGDDADGWRQRLAQLPDDSPPATLDALAGRSLRLAAPAASGLVLPLSMSETGTAATPIMDSADMAQPGKDGLDTFEPESLFLDEQLAEVGARALRGEAENILYLRQPPGKLRKLHSLFPVDEIGLLAIPDLAHLGFSSVELPPAEPPPGPEPEQKDRSVFADCPVEAAPSKPGLPEFAPCPQPFVVELPQSQPGLSLPTLETPQEYNQPDGSGTMSGLLAVQRALINLCAAQADRMAILTLPRHFTRREALEWHTQLSETPEFYDGGALWAPLSYAAVYHPWLEIREETTPQLAPLRALPPDGAVCGMIAARELARGPWIAPANESLRGVVRLDPPLSTGDWEALFNRRINLVRQQPGRFTLLSAHTLCRDRLLLQISVRRLLIYLRKLALRRGEKYVFENNTPRFRQTVQVSFERALTTLMQRGAMAAFEVSAGREYNSEQDEFNGRLIVAIKIAPTTPIEFITVVMLRAGDSLLEVRELVTNFPNA